MKLRGESRHYLRGGVPHADVYIYVGGRSLTIGYEVTEDVGRVMLANVQAAIDAATEAPLWAAELRAMADQLDGDGCLVHGPAYASTLAAELREAADDPPQGEEAFRFRLCLIMDWHPRRNADDLDRAIALARKRGS